MLLPCGIKILFKTFDFRGKAFLLRMHRNLTDTIFATYFVDTKNRACLLKSISTVLNLSTVM